MLTMEDVRFYDFGGHLLHIEHDIVSCNWKFYYNDIGTFEMHFPLRSKLTEKIMQNKYLVAVQGSKQAIVTGRQMSEEGILYGRSCNWLLSRFCTAEAFDTDVLSEEGAIAAKDAQSICEYIVGKLMGDIPNFVFLQNTEDSFGESHAANNGVSSAFDLIRDCLSEVGAGHTVSFDVANKCFVFRAVKGKELSATLSEANRNSYETEYSQDLQNFFTGGWYEQEMQEMGDWNAEENSPTLTNNQTENFAKAYRVSVAGTRFGIVFAEGDYIVCKEKEGAWQKAETASAFWVHVPSPLEGIYAWETQLSGGSEAEAQKALAGYAEEETVTAKTRKLFYGRDYSLGDFVRTEIAKGGFRTLGKQRITGVHLWYESGERGEQPIMEGLDVI